MSASSTEDLYSYKYYRTSNLNAGPNFERKTSKIIKAVVQNNVEVLKEELDSPKWYSVTDKDGYTLLQIAMLQNNKEVFDYMLSIRDFPLESVDKRNETALQFTLGHPCVPDEYFACELVKMGACINLVNKYAKTPLHSAVFHAHDEVALLLIRMGADVNAYDYEGVTPISVASSDGPQCSIGIETFAALLVQGAVVSSRDFEESVFWGYPPIIQEHLFLHAVDQYSKIHFYTLLHLAQDKSPIFDQILKSSCKITYGKSFHHRHPCFNPSDYPLCSLETNHLMLIIQRFRKHLAKFLYTANYLNCTNFRIENLYLLMENEFGTEVVDYLSMSGTTALFRSLIKQGYNESRLSQVFLSLLSYGLVITEQHLQLVYCQFGNCELFKLLLHMDFKLLSDDAFGDNKDIMAVFMYNVTMTIPRFLKYYEKFSYSSIKQLSHYFSHPSLSGYKIPRLLELARNSFRSYFIATFKIQTSREFYTLLRHLPISSVHERIISYETKIYD